MQQEREDMPLSSPLSSLLASDQTIETIMHPDYWLSLCPHLHVSSPLFVEDSPLVHSLLFSLT